MASTIRVDALQDTGANDIITSDSAGTFTYAAASGANFTALDADNVSAGTLAVARGGTGATTGAGMTLISTVTASSDATVTFTGLTTSYPVYLITINNVISSSDGDAIRVALSSNSGSSYVVQGYGAISTFNTNGAGDTFATTTGLPNAAGALAIGYYISNTAAETWNANLYLYNFATATISSLLNVTSVGYTSQNKFEYGSDVTQWATGANTEIQFDMATGDIATGTFKLYGLL